MPIKRHGLLVFVVLFCSIVWETFRKTEFMAIGIGEVKITARPRSHSGVGKE